MPTGDIVAIPMRGTMLGNRGGRLHDPDTKELHKTRRWASKQWICCETSFNGRQREVMGHSYTELFFLDEVTAFAAGHRPCFECRRKAFLAFAAAVARANGLAERMTAPAMDTVLHAERLQGRVKRTHALAWGNLPDGAAVLFKNRTLMKNKGQALEWWADGYRSHGLDIDELVQQPVECLTPPLMLSALAHGYPPRWHVSADTA
ncbi:hypothetical protein ACFQ14_07085 [Pseudahrensia aquimaris]|uniref:Uncharacterized protein n=1 Tax=Pseudahrensia aquimaris TaxID=744461 RepID=A0ABW3FH73_9HYPH